MHSALHILPHVSLMMPLEPTSTYIGTTVQPDAFTNFSNLLYFAFLHMYNFVRFSSHGDVSSIHTTFLSLSENMSASGRRPLAAMCAGIVLCYGYGYGYGEEQGKG